jgi:hypothetical protein
MTSIIKVDTIQDQDGNNIINENADTITIGASGDTITIPAGATFDASASTTTLPDDSVTTAKIVDANVTLAKLSATGTKDATTFLRGDNTFDIPCKFFVLLLVELIQMLLLLEFQFLDKQRIKL